jgi:hypothetical protein
MTTGPDRNKLLAAVGRMQTGAVQADIDLTAIGEEVALLAQQAQHDLGDWVGEPEVDEALQALAAWAKRVTAAVREAAVTVAGALSREADDLRRTIGFDDLAKGRHTPAVWPVRTGGDHLGRQLGPVTQADVTNTNHLILLNSTVSRFLTKKLGRSLRTGQKVQVRELLPDCKRAGNKPPRGSFWPRTREIFVNGTLDLTGGQDCLDPNSTIVEGLLAFLHESLHAASVGAMDPVGCFAAAKEHGLGWEEGLVDAATFEWAEAAYRQSGYLPDNWLHYRHQYGTFYRDASGSMVEDDGYLNSPAGAGQTRYRQRLPVYYTEAKGMQDAADASGMSRDEFFTTMLNLDIPKRRAWTQEVLAPEDFARLEIAMGKPLKK